MSVFINRLKYHYKKYLAIFFACLGVGCFIGDFLLTAIYYMNGSETVLSGTLDAIDLILYLAMIVCFVMLLLGNIRGSFLAFQGLLTFVFYELFSKGRISLVYLVQLASIGSEMDVVSFALTLFLAISASFVVVSGIFSYIRTRQFLNRTYGSYRVVRGWSLAFTLGVSVCEGLYVALYAFIYGFSLSTLLYVLTPLGAIFMALSCFFTTLRLAYD